MRFAMRSRRGPHAPIGHNAPKVLPDPPLCCHRGEWCSPPCSCLFYLQGLREDIDSSLSRVQEIRFEPRLLSEEDDRLKHVSQISESHIIAICVSYNRCVFCAALNGSVCFSKLATTTSTE